MYLLFFFVSCGPRTALHHRVHSTRDQKKKKVWDAPRGGDVTGDFVLSGGTNSRRCEWRWLPRLITATISPSPTPAQTDDEVLAATCATTAAPAPVVEYVAPASAVTPDETSPSDRLRGAYACCHRCNACSNDRRRGARTCKGTVEASPWSSSSSDRIHVAPASCAAQARVIENVAPTPVDIYTVPSSVIEYVTHYTYRPL